MFDSEIRYPFTKSLTFRIIILNAIVWVIQLIAYPLFDVVFALKPSLALSGQVYQFFTYMFLHATYAETAQGVMIYPAHIAINMLILAIFGFPLEQTLGKRRFMIVYVVSGIGSAIFYLLMMAGLMGVFDVRLIGASGAVFGVLAAYAFKYPKTWVYFLGFFPMQAAAMIVFFLIEETFFGFMGLEPGIANFGHVGGIITGLLVMAFWKIKEREIGERDFEYVWE
jgi:membrane associated rhomboid family serine protease